jgi:hypothetical protein
MKIFCHRCGDRKTHVVISEIKEGSGADEDYSWGKTHRFTQCAGCDAFTYSIESWTESDWNYESEEMDTIWESYPPPPTLYQTMDGEEILPEKIRLIYNETIVAMHAKLPLLSGIGLRALIESICKDQGICGQDLKERIDGLASGGVLTKKQSEIFHAHRFLGNAAAHEITPAQPSELAAALEIAEHMLRTIYIIPELSKKVMTGRKN